ncbi:odorant receptor 49b-like isoform X2 [Polyergus mexicanus]|uniref:odorant receptor 49b-like isoform X2 n=1 Tax=Polyergus mexicanus TaxID=615972 RepID=UPI0038B6A09D
MSQNIYLLSRRRSERIIDISYSHYLDPMAGERWKNDIAYAMTPFKFIAWPIGVWPLQHYNFYSLLRSALGTCGASVMVILPSIELCMGCTDAEQNVDSIMLICCGTLGVLKMIWFRIYANSLTVNYSSAMKDYLTIENVEERAIMRKHALIGRIVSCPMLCFSYFSCIMYGLIPLLGYDKRNQINVTNEDLILEYVIPSACTMKYLNTPASMYKVLCLIQVVAMILSTNAHIGNDALFLNIVLHICGQVKILRAHFIDFNVTSPRICDRFNALIQRHCYLIMLTRKLANMISFVLLIELFIISILLCIMGFQFILAMKNNDIVMMTKSLIVQSVFLIQITVYSFIGNYLKSQMEEIRFSIYQSAWYDLPAKLMKNLVFIFMQTESPVILQAGNFITINLSTYMSILKTSFSYLSVLRVMMET